MCKEYDRSTATIIHGKAGRDPYKLRPTKLMLTTCCNNNRKERMTNTTNKDTIVNCLVLLFERVPEVAIDQNQESMIDTERKNNTEERYGRKKEI